MNGSETAKYRYGNIPNLDILNSFVSKADSEGAV